MEKDNLRNDLHAMPHSVRLAFKAIVYETFAILVVYFISKWWFGEPPDQTMEYTIVVFIALCIYYFTFHYIFDFVKFL